MCLKALQLTRGQRIVDNTQNSPLLRLPGEIHVRIYDLVFRELRYVRTLLHQGRKNTLGLYHDRGREGQVAVQTALDLPPDVFGNASFCIPRGNIRVHDSSSAY